MALEILGLIVAGAGASYGWWNLQRRRDEQFGKQTFERMLDADANIAFSVAVHEAKQRGHDALWPVHVLYGLLQIEAFTAAITKLGGHPDAIENRVLAELARSLDNTTGPAEVQQAVSHALAVARHHDKQVTIADLWARLGAGSAKLLDIEPQALLFVLVHGMEAPPADLPGRTDVHVILRNDDYTTQEFVTTLLRDVFSLSEADAHARMLETHTQGKTIVGRYKLAVARDKITTARSRARAEMFPLWVALEDC